MTCTAQVRNFFQLSPASSAAATRAASASSAATRTPSASASASASASLCRHVSVGEHAACATVLDGAGAGQYRRVVGWTKGEKNPDKTINCDSLLVPIKPSNDSAARHRQHQAGLVLLVASAMQGEGAYVLSNIEGEESVSAPAEALPTLSEGTASVAGT